MAEESFAGGSWDEEPYGHTLREIVVPPLQDQDFAGERWLSRVKNYKVGLPGEVQDKDRVKIPKVSWEVTDKKLYEPEAVSIGPYHHNKDPKLRYVQELKVGFAHAFIIRGMVAGSPSVEEVYGKVRKVAGEARTYYSQEALGGMTDEEFTEVMFLDGCFVLEFIRTWRPEVDFTKHLQMDAKLIRLVVRDLFLLDNQVPFIVLIEALSAGSSNRLNESVTDFLTAYSFPGIRCLKFQNKAAPIHLLDFLSQCLYDPRDNRPGRKIANGEWLICPSVKRLEEAGVDCWPTKSRRATAIRFNPKLFTAELEISPVFIGEHSMAYWLNLAAYQAYSDYNQTRGTGAAEYICLLGKLIDKDEDASKLRAKQIICHDLKSDEHVVDAFRNMSNHISRDLGMAAGFPMASGGKERLVVKEIQDHLGNTYRRWVYKNIYFPYFRSPWSVPAFLAAVAGLILTFLQVYYTIYPRAPLPNN